MKTNELLSTIDAKVWAKEFMRIFGNAKERIDEGLMIGWFANSIMTGYDKGYKQAQNDDDLFSENTFETATKIEPKWKRVNQVKTEKKNDISMSDILDKLA